MRNLWVCWSLAAVAGAANGCAAITAPDAVDVRASQPAVSLLRVVVFDVEDKASTLSAEQAGQVSDLFRAHIGALSRFLVVPGQQIREQLQQSKREGYAPGRDEATQIEIGKAVSAAAILRPQIVRVGRRCTISAGLYDLTTESEIQRRSLETDCGLDRQREAWLQLARAYGRPAGVPDAEGQWAMVSETVVGSDKYQLDITQRGDVLIGTSDSVRWEGRLNGRVFKGTWKNGLMSGRLEVNFSENGRCDGKYGLGQADLAYAISGERTR
ncbi:MAG: hypothetical protein AAF449_00300 [Myxococcota bacterium]